jgi:energy-coupling factor transporter ATP-binding protein EcfA2
VGGSVGGRAAGRVAVRVEPTVISTVISARGVEKRYGRKRALPALDLDVERGAFLVVTGRNGSGKTTLLRLIAGLAAPTRGLPVDRVRLLRRVLEPAVDLRVELTEAPVHRRGDRLQAPVDLGVPHREELVQGPGGVRPVVGQPAAQPQRERGAAGG